MKSVGKPDALIGHVRFDERGRETGRLPKAQATAPFLDSTTSLKETAQLFAFAEAVPAVRRRSIGAVANAGRRPARRSRSPIFAPPEMSSQRVEKIKSAPGNGMGSECLDPQDLGARRGDGPEEIHSPARHGGTSECIFSSRVLGPSKRAREPKTENLLHCPANPLKKLKTAMGASCKKLAWAWGRRRIDLGPAPPWLGLTAPSATAGGCAGRSGSAARPR